MTAKRNASKPNYELMYLELLDSDDLLAGRIVELIRERDELQLRLAESEVGAARMRCAIELIQDAARQSDTEETFGEALTEVLGPVNDAAELTAGRDFLNATIKCKYALQHALVDIQSCVEFPENHEIEQISDALVALEPFLGKEQSC